MAFTDLTYAFGSLLTSTKMTQMFDNDEFNKNEWTGIAGFFNVDNETNVRVLDTSVDFEGLQVEVALRLLQYTEGAPASDPSFSGAITGTQVDSAGVTMAYSYASNRVDTQFMTQILVNSTQQTFFDFNCLQSQGTDPLVGTFALKADPSSSGALALYATTDEDFDARGVLYWRQGNNYGTTTNSFQWSAIGV